MDRHQMTTTQSGFTKYPVPLVCAALILLVLAAFEPVRHNDFVNFDDERYFLSNPAIGEGLTWDSVKWAFTSNYAAYWCPVTWLSIMADIEWFGLNPLVTHIHNLVLHTLNTLLLFLILRNITRSLWCSAFAAVIFGIHPLRVESVAWAVERKDVLYAFFWMLTIAAYAGYARHGGWARYLLVVVCHSLGLMAKPMMVTLPVILLVLDFWPLGRSTYLPGPECRPVRPLGLLFEKIPLLILSALTCVMIYQAHHAGGVVNYLQTDRLDQIANIPVSYIRYVQKIFWPVNLAVLYPFPERGWPLWIPISALLLLAAVSATVVFYLKKLPFLAAGWLWFLIVLLPIIGVVPVGSQAIADRYTYLSSIGISIMVIWAIRPLIPKVPYYKITIPILSIVIIIAMIATARKQTSYWRDSIALYRHTVDVTQDNYIIAGNLGACLMDRGQFKEAQHYLQKSLSIRPDYLESNLNMADLLKEFQQYDQALIYIEKAISLNPDSSSARLIQGGIFRAANQPDKAMESFEKAIVLDSSDFRPFYDAAVLLSGQNKPDKAIPYFKECLRCNPTWAPAYRDMGIAQQRTGQFEDALASYHAALTLIPTDYISCFRIGICYQNLRRPKDAVHFYRKALTLQPNLWHAMHKLAWLLATSPLPEIRNPAEALTLAQNATPLSGGANYWVMDTLAAAFAANGQFKEAAETADKAISLAQKKNDTAAVTRFAARLRLYQNNTPYTEPTADISLPTTPISD